MRRKLLVGLGLAAAGAAFGTLAATIAAVGLLVCAVLAAPNSTGLGELSRGLLGTALVLAAMVGAPLGAILALVAGLTFMRRVPLWRLFLDPTLGAVFGAVLGSVLSMGGPGVIGLATAGCFAAGARVTRRAARAAARDRSVAPAG